MLLRVLSSSGVHAHVSNPHPRGLGRRDGRDDAGDGQPPRPVRSGLLSQLPLANDRGELGAGLARQDLSHSLAAPAATTHPLSGSVAAAMAAAAASAASAAVAAAAVLQLLLLRLQLFRCNCCNSSCYCTDS